MKKHKTLIVLILAFSSISFMLKAQTNQVENLGLSPKQQSLVAIAALTATSDLTKLKTELDKGLEAGLTVNQIKEAIVHIYAYAGFPRSIRGLQTFMAVLDERKAKGINDVAGAEASPINNNSSKYERGKAVLEQLTGIPETGPKTGYAAFAPVIEIFLKEHLFADIFERDVLTYAERELVTISVLSSLGGLEPMLRSHLSICLNLGLTSELLHKFTGVIKSTVGEREAMAAQAVLTQVLKEKQSIGQREPIISASADTIFPRGVKITNNNFTGTAYLKMLIDADSLNPIAIGNVTFEPGARTKWHLHPGGQILLATDGVGYYQEKGQPKKILRKGDVVKCPPNVPHWHGASADVYFVQVAITSNHKGPTVWLESVTDGEYKD